MITRVEIHTKEGTLTDTIDLKLFDIDFGEIPRCIRNTEKAWIDLNVMSEIPGLELLVVHTYRDGARKVTPWKQSAPYRCRNRRGLFTEEK